MRRFVALLALSFAVGGCYTGSTLSPYRTDVSEADGIDRVAANACAARRGYQNVPPQRFTTDGCSMWPDDGWTGCCLAHDMAYWCGGTDAEREEADAALAACVSKTGSAGMGDTVAFGSRVGGAYWLPTPWRWGYGWNWPWQLERVKADPRPETASR